MPDNQSHTEQGQVERAKRLRERIEQLRRGVHVPDDSKKEQKSLKEQIEERAEERK